VRSSSSNVLAGEELIKRKGKQVRSSSRKRLAGEELFKSKGKEGLKLSNHKSWKAKIS
jgi:hypothetical protein